MRASLLLILVILGFLSSSLANSVLLHEDKTIKNSGDSTRVNSLNSESGTPSNQISTDTRDITEESLNDEIRALKDQLTRQNAKLEDGFLTLQSLLRDAITGRIKSPSRQRQGTYMPKTDITWTIVVPKGHKLRFTIEWMDLQLSGNCVADFVQATDMETNEVFFKRCGSNYSPIDIFNGTKLLIRFKTDPTVEKTGFSLFYESFVLDPPSAVPNVKFYEHAAFQGLSLETTIPHAECYNFGKPFTDGVSSASTGERCIKLFTGVGCTGNYVRLYPGSHFQQTKFHSSFNDHTKSFSSCLFTENTYTAMLPIVPDN